MRIEGHVPSRPSRIDSYRGVMVFAEQSYGVVHPVTYELIGKGRELADQLQQSLMATLVGDDVRAQAEELLHYGVDSVYQYQHEALRYYRPEPYTAALEEAVKTARPAILLLGATPVGRSLAPRTATRLGTGLTADCTQLELNDAGELVQIRPAFGGNVMARIVTPHHRPAMATVRYKVMKSAGRRDGAAGGRIIERTLRADALRSAVEIEEVHPRQLEHGIIDAEVIVAGGRGLRRPGDMAMLESLAQCLGGMVAVSRPLVEQGWADQQQQVGMSGRTVRPRLYIACGISGAIQHVAGMSGADTIVAINSDPDAPILGAAHYGIVGDLYEVIPRLIDCLKTEGKLDGVAV